MYGGIEARSEGLGRGSTFVVRLPVPAEVTHQQPIAPDYNEKVSAALQRRVLCCSTTIVIRRSACGQDAVRMCSEMRTTYDGFEAVEIGGNFPT
jgi:hypothetical protein